MTTSFYKLTIKENIEIMSNVQNEPNTSSEICKYIL